ncbi:MAG: IF-2 protein, partial [Myxococcaceae bacterium]
MAHPDTFGSRATRALIRLVTVVGVIALLGAVGVLLSELNARTFTVEAQDGRLVVMKGRHLPVSAEPYQPDDASLADTYAPIP